MAALIEFSLLGRARSITGSMRLIVVGGFDKVAIGADARAPAQRNFKGTRSLICPSSVRRASGS
ncbi:hypothetical protein [Bradyrhizobium sp.]|jgi:hypothetical protein|uniref:hypothetical protein n=1 Tax=Bradyrhizobium sp. TaxID=376 RepID=UPI002DF767E9|nr:hypothetical protein [Bradyrhizobium sp.]